MSAYDNYTLTEDGLVAKFLQPCGCSAEGPGANCPKGKTLYKAMDADTDRWLNNEITLKESDVSLTMWQEHLGA